MTGSPPPFQEPIGPSPEHQDRENLKEEGEGGSIENRHPPRKLAQLEPTLLQPSQGCIGCEAGNDNQLQAPRICPEQNENRRNQDAERELSGKQQPQRVGERADLAICPAELEFVSQAGESRNSVQDAPACRQYDAAGRMRFQDVRNCNKQNEQGARRFNQRPKPDALNK